MNLEESGGVISTTAKEPPEHFIIKYENEDQRKYLVDKVLELVKQFELTDFHIEEQKAFQKVRIIYNTHTLAQGTDFTFEEIKHEFLKYFRY